MPIVNTHRRAWLIKAPLGLLLTGFGLCLLTEAGMAKFAGDAWFWRGTLALVVFNAGLCVFGDAVRHRILMDQGKSEAFAEANTASPTRSRSEE